MFTINGEYTSAKVYVDNENSVNEDTISQLYSMTNHPAFTNPIRVMPDVHPAKGAVVGFSMPLGERIVPQVVGTDIGCGMHAWNLGDSLPLENQDRDERIRKAVPGDGRNNDTSTEFIEDAPYNEASATYRQFAKTYQDKFNTRIEPPFPFTGYDKDYARDLCERLNGNISTFSRDVGTLGGGNHFIEFGQSTKTDDYWLVIHSGSRGFGKAVAKHWIKRADGHPSMGWLENEDAHGYFVDMIFAQAYATWNRQRMGNEILDILDVNPVDDFSSVHNYVDFKDLIIRKGATRSHTDERLVIPMDMASGVLICEGKSNNEANFSAPHGAGRVMSRGDAKAVLSVDEFENEVDDVYANGIGKSLISESPQAYKDPEFLLDQLEPLATPVDHIKPVHSIKHR